MPVRMKLPVLPVYYYHDHFTEMLFFVSETYVSPLAHHLIGKQIGAAVEMDGHEIEIVAVD